MLHIHRAERADRLADALATIVVDPLDDPFAPEIVSVPTRGAERWLAQRLSSTLGASAGRGDGVCANIEFPFPGKLVTGAVAVATDVDPDTDPWPPERSVWPLLDVVADHLDDEWLGPLAAHLGHGGTGGERSDAPPRRFGAVRHLAALFDHYGVHRPSLIRAWAAGDDTDGEGIALAPELIWQAELWRRLRARVDTASPAERLDAACERLRAEPKLLDLPSRLSLFGLTRLPASYLDVLRAVAAERAVHLFLLHPSPALWDRLAASGGPTGPVPRTRDLGGAAATNPLLASWGRDVREMQLVVSAGDVVDQHHALDQPPDTLLHRLQIDIRDDRRPIGPPLPGHPDERPLLDANDRSVQVHACHGRARQVETLREAILHLLADDPTLEPRDVIVMCPDIDAFAPLIHATFGVGRRQGDGDETHDGDDDGIDGPDELRPQDLRVRLADRSIRQTNPVLAVVSELLALVPGRLTASHVIDLAGREPLRRRFGFDDDDLARIEEWAAATGIRWGIDAAHRAPFKLDTLTTGTWRAGLDRVLVGITMDERGQRLVGDVLPLDDVDSGDIELAGRLAELVDRIEVAVGALSGRQPVERWADAIATAADALTTTRPDDAWQRAQLARLLDDVVAEAGGSGAVLDLDEVRELLADRLRGRPTRANFRTGHLTMCTLVPMRSVPHRVVALLGLDDGEFPRQSAPDGDDLIQRTPRVGDHDPRSEDRQLLLDAVLSATQHLVVTYTGRDERTNAVHPPAVPLGELLDVVDRTVRTESSGVGDGDRPPARQQIVTHHPLQPFDLRNFTAGELAAVGPWSFDPVALDGARATTRPRTPARPFLDEPLPPVDPGLVELDDLIRFVQHPTKAFLRQRLGVSVRDGDEDTSDALPVELDNLERWGIGQRMLEARLAGVDGATCRAAELARGVLPPGVLGTRLVDDILPGVDAIAAVATEIVPVDGERRSFEINLDLGGGRVLVGSVGDAIGPVIRAVTYSRLGAKHRLTSWIRLLAVIAQHPSDDIEAVTIGRAGRRVSCSTLRIDGGPALRAATATQFLADVIDLYDRGRCEPLPLFVKTSGTYAQKRQSKSIEQANAAAAKDWETSYGSRWDNEDRDLEHQLVFGRVMSYADLLLAPPEADEQGDGWATDEISRFGRLARRLWDPLLAAETVKTS